MGLYVKFFNIYKKINIYNFSIYIYKTCPPCPIFGVVVSPVEYSYFRVLCVLCPRVMWLSIKQKQKTKLKLSKEIRNFFFLTFLKTKLFKNETTFSYSTLTNYSISMQTWKWKGRYKLPPNGGRGVWEPLSHLLFINFYNAFWCFLSFLKEQGEKGKERRGKCFCLFALSLFLCLPLAFGILLIFLKVRALNTEMLYVSQK